MAKATLIENDIWDDIASRAKPKGLRGRSIRCEVMLDLDNDAYDALDDDPLLLAKVTQAATDAYQDCVKTLESELKAHDKLYLKAIDSKGRKAAVEAFRASARKELIRLSKTGAQNAEAAWAQVARTKKEYTKYKVKAGCSIAIDGLGFVAGVALGVGSSGFALFATIYTSVKTIISIANKLRKLAMDADKMQRKVKKGLAAIQKAHDSNKKELSGAKDTGKAALNTLLGTDFMPTVGSTKADNNQYKSKLQGVDVSAHSAARELGKVLKALDAAAKMPEAKNAKVKAAIKSIEDQMTALVVKIEAMQEQIAAGMAFHEDTAAALTQIGKEIPKKWKYLQKGLPLVDIVLAGGDFAEAASASIGVVDAAMAEIDRQLLDRV